MMYFDKNDDRVLFGDIRSEVHTLCDGRQLHIAPDHVLDFTQLPFADESFHMVVFDPPHLQKLGKNTWMAAKYGVLPGDWRTMIGRGFAECFRVLKPNGTLIFKWSEVQIPCSEVMSLTQQKPVFGTRNGKKNNTHWIVFMKGGGDE